MREYKGDFLLVSAVRSVGLSNSDSAMVLRSRVP